MLEIVIGPMYSGKTTYLIDKIKLFQTKNESYLVFNHFLDTRYSIDNITNHNRISIKCSSIKKIEELFEINQIEKIKHILIDECQFFDDLEINIKKLINKYPNLNIYCVGLDGDYQQNYFNDGQLLKLIPKASNLVKLYSKCYQCNEKAAFTKRIINDETQIIIASDGVYVPCCIKHLKC